MRQNNYLYRLDVSGRGFIYVKAIGGASEFTGSIDDGSIDKSL